LELKLIGEDGSSKHSKIRFKNSTSNNARTIPKEKREYFRIVCDLVAIINEVPILLLSKISDGIQVRGQNPGRFVEKEEVQTPVLTTKDRMVVVDGKLGVGMLPTEAVSVKGNVLLTGNVLKPSDRRIKTDLSPVDNQQQYSNIEKLDIFDYQLKPLEGCSSSESTLKKERGIIAQQLQEYLPHAVRKLGPVTLENGEVVDDLLVIDERALLYENIGATQYLGSEVFKEKEGVSNLQNRLEEFEKQRIEIESETTGIVDNLIDYVSDSQFQRDYDDGSALCYCNFLGVGPAWTLWLCGFFFPPFWMIGICYLSSRNTVRKRAGVAHLVSFFAFILLAVFYDVVLPRYTAQFSVGFAVLCFLFVGVICVTILTFIMTKKNQKERKKSMVDETTIVKKETEIYVG